MRIAFDHMGVRKPYEKSVHMAADNDITSLSNYMLYNFMDTPEDLYERMHVNIHLNEERGIRIWSFPMRYQPVQLKDRSHVGKNWNRYYLRSFQIMLQATRGVVSGNPSFFRRAYGEDQDEFLHLLSLPHAFIFHRDYFENEEGRSQRDEYEALRRRLSDSQERELIHLLSGPEGATGWMRDGTRSGWPMTLPLTPYSSGDCVTIRWEPNTLPKLRNKNLSPCLLTLTPTRPPHPKMRWWRTQGCSTMSELSRPGGLATDLTMR